MVGERGLRYLEQRHELADADLAGVLSQYVHELQPDRIAESLRDLGQTQRLLTLNVGVDDGLAAPRPAGSLLLRG